MTNIQDLVEQTRQGEIAKSRICSAFATYVDSIPELVLQTTEVTTAQVKNASYDKDTETISLNLRSGDTVSFPSKWIDNEAEALKDLTKEFNRRENRRAEIESERKKLAKEATELSVWF